MSDYRPQCGCDDSCEQFRALERENERLRAAIKPVLSVNVDGALKKGCGIDCTTLYGAIIKDAQRIAKEGEANDEEH